MKMMRMAVARVKIVMVEVIQVMDMVVKKMKIRKKKMEKKYIFYNLRNPTLDHSEYNFINKFTKSRLRQIDDGLVGLLSEIWFNKELV